MKLKHQLKFLPSLLFLALIFIASCSSEVDNSSDSGVSDEPGQEASDSAEGLTICEQILAGYLIKLNQDQIEICKTDSTYETANGELVGLPNNQATFYLSAHGIEKLKVQLL